MIYPIALGAVVGGAGNRAVQPRRLFVGCCFALATSAFTFVIRSDILQEMGNHYGLSQADKGWIEAAVWQGIALALLFGGVAAEIAGLGRLLKIAFVLHLGSVVALATAPSGFGSFFWLFSASLLMGLANGLIEATVNPLVAILYPERKTESLNRMHAWFPAGLVLGGLAAQGMHRGFGLDWRLTICLVLLPCLGYGLLILGQRFPTAERESSNSRSAMYGQALRPAFLILVLCAMLAHASEVAPSKWLETVISCTSGVSGTLVLVYTGALMFAMRQFAGPIAEALTPAGMLAGSATLAGVGLYLLSTAASGLEAFAFATIYGVGIGRLWPTLVGYTAERFPAGGAFVLALLGLAGSLSTAQVMPVMGHTFDSYALQKLAVDDPELAGRVAARGTLDPAVIAQLGESERATVHRAEAFGASMTYRWACLLPTLLLVVLLLTVVRFRAPAAIPNEAVLESSTA
jgi:MFS family permease